ncbi:hypothetical protein [Serratia proteamaculans]|uniref:hypothetical protein n=1 Tax=Serratia proteamaculans TaxID=28151 RepID=UPI0021839CF6|nr:hypothetical protein [Serratia proteamaculans]CAI2487217.1 Uncharacterised protein [Serratia proteamaculans]
MNRDNLKDYLVTLYGINSSSSPKLDARDAQNIVSDIFIAFLLNEIPAERKSVLTQKCGDIIRSATARGETFSPYHDQMLKRLSTISQISSALMEDEE